MSKIYQQTTKYFWTKTLKYKWMVLGVVISLLVGTLSMAIVAPWVYKQIIDLLSTQTDRLAAFTASAWLLFYLLLIYLLGNVGWRSAEYINAVFQPNVMRDIENDCFQKLENHSYNFFANRFGGALVTQTNRITRAFETITDNLWWDLIPTFNRSLFSAIVLFFFAPSIAWIIVGWVILYIVVIGTLYKWKYKYDLANSKADSKVTAELADGITNMLNIKMFAKKAYEAKRFFSTSDFRAKARKKAWTLGTHIHWVQGLLMTGAEIGVMFLALRLWYLDAITIGTVVLVQTYIGFIFFGLWQFGRVIRNMYEAYANAEEMTEILNLEEDIKDPEKPESCKIKKGHIALKEVSFSYEKTKVYSNFNLRIKPGESIGLVGESGSGKSTLTKLLLRYADIQKGSIEIDGQDIRTISQEDLRRNISYVPQDPILFHRSLKENIAYSNPKATFKQIVQVAKKANVHSFIMSLPEKYNTLVGERGIKLSGGERQRIAIARAMLKKAPILILDEATSSLDSKSEKLIQDALKKLVKGKTTIAIAHRLSTIQQMDRILVLHKGKIVEQGSHKQLLKKKGKYAELWSHQVGGFLQDE